jgi:dienelactone hydrolase
MNPRSMLIRMGALLAVALLAGRPLEAQLPPDLARVGDVLGPLEQTAEMTNHDTRLRGWLVLPPGVGPHPVVVFLHGSGPGPGRNPFSRTMSASLLARGVGAFYFDKRAAWERASFETLADDALAWIAWLEKQARVDPKQIGVLGFSQGGWIGPLVAARRPTTSLVVAISPSGVPPLEQGWFADSTADRRRGLSPEEVARSAVLRRALALYYSDPTESRRDAAQQLLDSSRKSSWLERASIKELTGVGASLPSPYRTIELRSAIPGLAAYAKLSRFDPLASLAQLRSPYLGVWGALDEIVPVDTSIALITAALRRAGNTDVTTRVFPGATHALLVGELTLPIPYAPGFIEGTADWIRSRLHVAEIARGSPLRSYALEITVPPSPPATNEVTFFGSEHAGVFVDRNLHGGSWRRVADTLRWTYTTVGGLSNTFVGSLSADAGELRGTNEGVWQGRPFAGRFVGRARTR